MNAAVRPLFRLGRDAWVALGDVPIAVAKEQYVALVLRLFPSAAAGAFRRAHFNNVVDTVRMSCPPLLLYLFICGVDVLSVCVCRWVCVCVSTGVWDVYMCLSISVCVSLRAHGTMF